MGAIWDVQFVLSEDAALALLELAYGGAVAPRRGADSHLAGARPGPGRAEGRAACP
jgi:hypothetical protein